MICWAAFLIKIGAATSTTDKSAITSGYRLFTFFYSGVLLHLYRDKIPLNAFLAALAGLGLIVGAVVGTLTFDKPGGVFYATAPAFLAYAVVYAAVRLPFIRLNAESDISYGLYIYGTFVIQVLIALGLSQVTSYPLFAACCVLATWPLAFLSWHFVERPAMTLRRNGSKRLYAVV